MLAVRIQAIDGTRTFTLLDSQPCRPLPSPPPHTARPVSREVPVDHYCDLRWGFPCCVWSPLRTCHRHYPGRFHGACSLVSPHGQRPSLCNSQVGSCNCFFGACSAFTHVMACTLAESPSDPLHRKLRQLRCLRCRFDCYRVERTSSRAGVAPTEVQRLFTAHCYNNYERCEVDWSPGWCPSSRSRAYFPATIQNPKATARYPSPWRSFLSLRNTMPRAV
jgi:hypothetical protein